MNITIEKCRCCGQYEDELADGICISCEETGKAIDQEREEEYEAFLREQECNEFQDFMNEVNHLHSDWEPEDNWDDEQDPYAHLFYDE